MRTTKSRNLIYSSTFAELLESRRLLSSTPIGFTPEQIRSAYGVNGISFNGLVGDGSGQTIAIVALGDNPGLVDSSDTTDYPTSDLGVFDATGGLGCQAS